jgi:hypothetical protein
MEEQQPPPPQKPEAEAEAPVVRRQTRRPYRSNQSPAQLAAGTKNVKAVREARIPVAERLGLFEPDEDTLDPETEALIADGILSRDEIIQLRIEAATKVAAEQKAARRKAALAKFVEDERRTAGLIKPEDAEERWRNEMVQVQVLLPSLKPAPGQGAPIAPDPIVLDGRPFYHGRTYSVSRVVALTLYDQMGRAAKHAAQVAGESPAYYSASRGIYSQAGEVMNWRPH